mmetsp:Transcript_15504/g.47269  ORF Transcript_15504/g.47269 Transcript_15504/m.47269 type:complete len:292 (-) Transcript_15504:679-1554(-)
MTLATTRRRRRAPPAPPRAASCGMPSRMLWAHCMASQGLFSSTATTSTRSVRSWRRCARSSIAGATLRARAPAPAVPRSAYSRGRRGRSLGCYGAAPRMRRSASRSWGASTCSPRWRPTSPRRGTWTIPASSSATSPAAAVARPTSSIRGTRPWARCCAFWRSSTAPSKPGCLRTSRTRRLRPVPSRSSAAAPRCCSAAATPATRSSSSCGTCSCCGSSSRPSASGCSASSARWTSRPRPPRSPSSCAMVASCHARCSASAPTIRSSTSSSRGARASRRTPWTARPPSSAI